MSFGLDASLNVEVRAFTRPTMIAVIRQVESIALVVSCTMPGKETS